MNLLFQLFFDFFKIGLFSIGGGYAIIPAIRDQVVILRQWITYQEFTDIITISQMTPGPIAINSATFVGEKIAGVPGAIVATLGCIMPSIIIVTIIAYFYMKYRDLDSLQSVLKTLRPAVVAMIASAGVSILVTAFFGESGLIVMKNLKIQMVVIFVICMVLLMKFKMSPVFVMILAGILNVMQYFLLSSLSLGSL